MSPASSPDANTHFDGAWPSGDGTGFQTRHINSGVRVPPPQRKSSTAVVREHIDTRLTERGLKESFERLKGSNKAGECQPAGSRVGAFGSRLPWARRSNGTAPRCRRGVFDRVGSIPTSPTHVPLR